MRAGEVTVIDGPAVMDCENECQVPARVRLVWVPPPRHAWDDVLHCPYANCDRAFLVVPAPQEERP